MQHAVLCLLAFSSVYNIVRCLEPIRVGIILKEGDTVNEQIIDNVFSKTREVNNVEKEKVRQEDTVHYHQAVCKLLNQNITAILSPTSPAAFPVLSAYSHNLLLVSPDLLDSPDDPRSPDLVTGYAVGVRPGTTRAVLDLVRNLEWKKMVYVYDKEHDTENLQIMFRVGYQSLRFKLIGSIRVANSREATQFLHQYQDGNPVHVILDTAPAIAREVLEHIAHDYGVLGRNFRFLLTQPALAEFWSTPELKALQVTGFLITPEYTQNTPDFKTFVNSTEELEVSNFYYHDAALFLRDATTTFWHHQPTRMSVPRPIRVPNQPDCFNAAPDGRLLEMLRKTSFRVDGLVSSLKFPVVKENATLTIVQSSQTGYTEYGKWIPEASSGRIHRAEDYRRQLPGQPLAQVTEKRHLKVVTVLSPPFMMLKNVDNSSALSGNDRFEGFCKDILDAMCQKLDLDCQLYLVEEHGRYDTTIEKWTGMMGEIIQSKAGLALGDLVISPLRQKIVHFTEPVGLFTPTALLRSPTSTFSRRSIYFPLSAFSVGVWCCHLLAVVVFWAAFQAAGMWSSGPPDTIESASGIWGRRNAVGINAWFVAGSALMQSTGVYPRSISSRILSCSWWFCMSVFGCLYVASITSQLVGNISGEQTPQMTVLNSLSLESVIREGLEKGWPKIGVISGSPTLKFIRNSGLPLYTELSSYLSSNPDLYVSTLDEGVRRIRDSDGGFILLTANDYPSRQLPCDIVSKQDPISFATYGFALSPSLDDVLAKNITAAIDKMQNDGLIGHFHTKWWIQGNKCQKPMIADDDFGDLYSFSGLFIVLFGGMLVIFIIFGVQFYRKRQDKEVRRQQLTFDDLNSDNRLPTPPPEMLMQPPPPVLNVPEIESRTRAESEGFRDFFQSMREQ